MAKLEYQAVTRLPDGAWVKAVDTELVPLADTCDGAHACRKLRYTRDGITAVFEVQGGIPVCIELTLTADTGLTTEALRAVKLQRLAQTAYSFAGTWVDRDGEWARMIGPSATMRDRKQTARTTRRRVVNDEFLDRVREMHDAATGTKTERKAAVAAELCVSTRQAARYLKQAGL
jgi:hypothetical protein